MAETVDAFAAVEHMGAREREAFRLWLSNRLYVCKGNYRIKDEGRQSGPIAPFNRALKQKYLSCAEFHRAARSEATHAED